jgi:chemotaxis protein CheX
MATATNPVLSACTADPLQLKAVVSAVDNCLMMCDAHARCVGISTIPIRDPGSITGMIGVHGDVSGFITVNLCERVALSLVGGLLQDQFDQVDHQIIDGVGEVTNIIAGGIKNGLAGTHWGFSHVTVPSVIVGRNYQIAYAKGLQYLSATFEHENANVFMLEERLLHVAISLIRL